MILFICDALHPRYAASFQMFSYGEMRHCVIGHSSMPMFDIGGAQPHVSLADNLYRASPFLSQSDAECNEQCLAQRMGMPVGARTRLKGNVGTVDALRSLSFKSRVNADITYEVLLWSWRGVAGLSRNHDLFLGGRHMSKTRP